MTLPNQAEFKAKYDLFFVKFANAYEKHINRSKENISSTEELKEALKDMWRTGWKSLERTFEKYGAYAMLFDRMLYLVKIYIHILPKRIGLKYTGEYELQFTIAPTYLPKAKQNLVYTKVIPELIAAGFTVELG